MNSALSQRLQRARQRLFVGRTPEITSWQLALQNPEWSIPIWHVHGLGGMGKTTLLRQWRRLAEEQGIEVVTLDARDFDPTPDAFCAALRENLQEKLTVSLPHPSTPADLGEAIAAYSNRFMLQIDTYELLEPLDDWLRESFLSYLPENCALTFAGRNPLPLSWRGDAGWQELVRSFDLSELSAPESSEYLERRGVAPDAQSNLLAWAHGHPLALSLSADIWLQRPEPKPLVLQGCDTPLEAAGGPFKPGDMPQLVGSLLAHLVREVPTKAHRIALEACAIVAVMTEELLAAMLPQEVLDSSSQDVHALFEWLRALSIFQTNRLGLFPHDLAREVLVADSRWRNPQWHGDLHRSAREHYLRLIQTTSGSEQQRAIFDCIYLHRMSPAVAPFLQWHDSRCTIDVAHPDELKDYLNWIEKFEGEASRQIAARWFTLQPENVMVIRNQSGGAQGLVFQLALHSAERADIEADPATQAAFQYLSSNAPLREGEKATLFRFWMDKDSYQDVGATQSLIFVQAVRHYIVTPNLAFTFFTCASPEFWREGFQYADLQSLPQAEFEISNHHYGSFGHDWRSRPVMAWFEVLSQREMQTVAVEPCPTPLETPTEKFRVLDEAAFHTAVRQALRQWSDPVSLRRNPLIETSLVGRRARQIAGNSKVPDDRELALRSLLHETVAALAVAPRQDKAYRALELVFGRRTLSQESAADVMDVSHSSFRRYLRTALQFIAESLWHRETARMESEPPFLPPKAEIGRNLNLF